MTWPGSFEERGSKAAGDALAFGASRLTAQFIGVVASFGATCLLKDREVANTIVQRNGRKPHPRSVARVRRQAARPRSSRQPRTTSTIWATTFRSEIHL